VKRATIIDVAELAGVSIKTVSRVLNREPKVRNTTIEKVKQAMQTLSYEPNSSGRRLASNRTFLIGLIYDNENANSGYINPIQDGALEYCRSEHYDILLHPCKYRDTTLLSQLRDLVNAPRVDGLLLTPPISDLAEVRGLLRELNTPNVILSRESVTDSDWTVCTDDQNVCADMVKRLARLGHQRIAYVCGHPDHRAMLNRHRGYLDGMRESELTVRKSMIVQGDLTFESGIDSALRLLRSRTRPTAIFCANDQMAAGVIKVAHEKGLSIPGDLSVAGFDDVPLAGQIWPQLTTIRQPLRRMSRLAGKLLIQRLHGESPSDVNRIIKSEIIIRDSTGPAPNNS